MLWSETFRAAIEKGVCDIADGELRKLNAGEKRQLLADLRERDDCPDGWKNKTPKKQQSIINGLHNAIARLLNPDKVTEYYARNYKRRIESGEAQEYAKKIKENGQQKAYNARYNADPINKEKKAKYKADPINKDKANARFRERYATDLKFRTMCILRARLRHALGNNKKDHTIDLLGCTVEQMVQHLEKQFTPGMTWNNQGKAD